MFLNLISFTIKNNPKYKINMYVKLGFGTGIFKFNSIKLEVKSVNINRTSMDGFTKIPRGVNTLTKAKIIAIE